MKETVQKHYNNTIYWIINKRKNQCAKLLKSNYKTKTCFEKQANSLEKCYIHRRNNK